MSIPTLTQFHQLAALEDGTRVAVEGPYRPGHSTMPRPGVAPVSAFVAVVGGRVLIGRYSDTESRRPEAELRTLDGCIVRVTGTYFRSSPTRPDPMPGQWTGGGPQLIDIDPPLLVQPAPVHPPDPPTGTVRGCEQVNNSDEPTLAGDVPHTEVGIERRHRAITPSRSARYSLASTRVCAILSIFAFAVGALTFWAAPALLGTVDFDTRLVVTCGVLVAGLFGPAAVYRHVSAGHAVRTLSSQPWKFDVESYLALLEKKHSGTLIATVQLSRSRSGREADITGQWRMPPRTTFRWHGDDRLRLETKPPPTRCPSMNSPLADHDFTPLHNPAVHRWYASVINGVLSPLHRQIGVREVRVASQ